MIVRIDDVNKPEELNEVWRQPLPQVSLEGSRKRRITWTGWKSGSICGRASMTIKHSGGWSVGSRVTLLIEAGQDKQWNNLSPPSLCLDHCNLLCRLRRLPQYPSHLPSQDQAVYDLAGNVWEWCSTRWQENHPLPVLESGWTKDYLAGDAV